MQRGTNSLRVGDFNERVILDCIRRSPGGLSRVEIAAATGLSSQTLSNVTRRLLNAQLITEMGRRSEGPGKPRTMLGINPRGAYAVGVHLDPLVMTLVITDWQGTVVARSQREVPKAGRPARVLARMTSAVEDLLMTSGVPRNKVAGLGVAAPGPVDMEHGVVVNPPLLAHWHDVPLQSALSDSLKLQVLLDKDATAAAVAEVWMQTEAIHSTFIFCYLGTGIGVGLVNNGEVLRGSSNNVGEMAHLIVDEEGPACWCGSHGCIGVCCSPAELVSQGVTAGILRDADVSNPQVVDRALDDLCRQAADGNGGAAAIIDTAGRRIARGIAVLSDLIDAEAVIFGGPLWNRLEPRLLRVLPSVLSDRAILRSVHPVRIRSTRFGVDVGAIGAATLVLDHTYSTRLDQLLLRPDWP